MKKIGMLMAILAAIFYVLSTPFAKILLQEIPPINMRYFLLQIIL